MYELIQNTTGLKLGVDRSGFYYFGGGGRSIEIVISATIIGLSRISL